MKKEKNIRKRILMTIVTQKGVQYSLVIITIILCIGSVINNKFFKKTDTNKLTTIQDSENSSNKDNTTKGVIYTDAEAETSSYTLSSGYSDVQSNESNLESNKYFSGKSNASSKSKYQTTSKIDKSSLKGNNISILEGDSFEPVKDLNLTATDKDGTNISDKIVIESNNVNSNKPGNYTVKVNVRLKDGYIIQKTFNVVVKETKLELSLNSFKPVKDIVEKNENVVLDLELSTSKSHITPDYIMINGEEYPLYKGSNSILSTLSNKQNYKVNVNSGNQFGTKTYKVSYIKMSDGTLINLDTTTNIEVLKSQAQIKNFYYEETALDKSIITKFDLEDLDDSALNLNMEVYKGEELVYSEKLDKKSKYELSIPIKTKGLYEVKVFADISLSLDENKSIKNKEIFSQNINITNIDESSITGENIELIVGSKFNPINDLNLKATDIDGEDITHNIVIDTPDIDTSIVGEYKVLVHVINKENKKLTGEFTVVVKNEPSFISKIARLFGIKNYKTKASRSYSYTRSNNNSTVTGNDTQVISSNVHVLGLVSKKDGEMPNGKLYVELPTRLSFSVDKKGNFTGGSYLINNKSSCDVELLVGEFRETDKDMGITVKALTQNIDNLDRSNVHLYLKGDNVVDLGEYITSDKPLATIEKSDTKSIQLLGKAGKGTSDKVDKYGSYETFNMIFKIKKRN